MDRVRRLFSNLQCCKSGTEGDSLKSRNEKYLMHVVNCADEDYEMKALPTSKEVAEEAFSDSKLRQIVRSRSCPEILERCDRDSSPPPDSASTTGGTGGGSRGGGAKNQDPMVPSHEKQVRPPSQQKSDPTAHPPHQRRRRQRRSHQQRLSVDERGRPRGPGDGGGGGGGGGRAEYLHAAGDYSDNLPDRAISSAPGGVSRP